MSVLRIRGFATLVGIVLAHGALGAADFGPPGTAMFGKAQREFYDGVLAVKRANAREHAKSLVYSHETPAVDRPPLDFDSASKNPAISNDAWLRHAANLYAGGQYATSAAALDRLDPFYRSENSVAVQLLQIRLALRGHARMPKLDPLKEKSPEEEFNLVLADLKVKNINGALQKLKEITERSSGAHRDRALIWRALILAERGISQDALAEIGQIDGSSPLLVDALLVWLRIAPNPDPGQVAAIERYIASVAPQTPLVWEARDRLLQVLRVKAAAVDLVSQATGAASELGRAIDILRRERKLADQGGIAFLSTRLALLPDDSRHRVENLSRQKDALEKLAGQLAVWQEHMVAYNDRLRNDSAQFSDEIAAEVHASQARRASDGSKLGALFHLELSKLVGSLRDTEAAYDLFFGLAHSELSYEYPAAWRPTMEQEPTKQLRGKRRQEFAKKEVDDKKYYPIAVNHIKKIGAIIDRHLAKYPKRVFGAMADESKKLIERTAQRRREIVAFLPKIDEAVRAEHVTAAREQLRIAQAWLVRFAAQAIADSQLLDTAREHPTYVLDRMLTPRKGESILASIQAITVPQGKRTATDVPLLGLLHALKSLTTEGDTREIRVDALRMRAHLAVLLSESQTLPSAADAVEHYTTLLRDYSDLVDQAEMTYQLARAYELTQQPARSLAVLEELTKRYPKDQRMPEAAFRIADNHFELSEYPKARVGYEGVIRTGDKRFVDQAEYKLAWTFYKLGDYKSALTRFVSVIDRGYGDKSGSDASRRNRMQDAFRALNLTLANLDGPAEVERFFSGKGKRPYVGDIYASLGTYFLEHQRVNDAATTYGYLHKHYPDHDRASDLLAAAALAARKERLLKLSLDLQELYVDRYAMNGAYWNQADADIRSRIRGNLKPFVAELAELYHADAQQQRKRDSYVRAIRLYSQFVVLFPEDSKTPQFHFQLAEARSETGELAGSIADYEKAAYDYGRHPKAAEAGYALLVNTQKLVAETTDRAARREVLRQLVARSGRYATAFPEDLRVEAVLVKAGEDTLAAGDPAEAVRLGEMLLARKPAEPLVRRAQFFSAHGYFESGAFAKAETAYLVVLDQKGRSATEVKELRERLGLSVYRQAEAQRDSGQKQAAVETFLRVGKTAPGTEAVPNGVIDAAAVLLELKRWSDAIELFERFEKTYPKHPAGANIPVSLAFAYENDGRFILAADTLEKLSLTENDDALARQMLWRSAELREKAGRMDLSIATYERYLARYPQPLEKATEVRQSLADLASKAKDRPRRDRWLNEIIANARSADGSESVRVRFLAARASVVLGDGANQEFVQVQLRLPLDKSLASKRATMETALRWYAEAGRYGIAEVTTQATFKTAEIYRQLARDVMASERPSGLSALEMSQYNVLLEEQATPFEEKSTEFHEVNYQRIASGIYDDWVKRSLVVLRTLLAGQYDKVEATVGPFAYSPPPPPPKPAGQAATGNAAGAAAGSKTQGASNAPPR